MASPLGRAQSEKGSLRLLIVDIAVTNSHFSLRKIAPGRIHATTNV